MMKNINLIVFGIGLFGLTSCADQQDSRVYSPDRALSARVFVGEGGHAYYEIHRNDSLIMPPGRLGVVMEDEDFSKNLSLDSVTGAERIKDE